jgi:hypothetical protein
MHATHDIKYTIAPVDQVIVDGDHHQVRVCHDPLPLRGIHGQVIALPWLFFRGKVRKEILFGQQREFHGSSLSQTESNKISFLNTLFKGSCFCIARITPRQVMSQRVEQKTDLGIKMVLLKEVDLAA